MYRTGMNERQTFPSPKRKLTEGEIIDEQGTREDCFTRKLYHIFSGVDLSVIDPLDFITIPHS
jgi:hypothetical protein